MVIKAAVDVACPLHAILHGQCDGDETAEEAALHTQPVFTAVLVVGVQDLVGDPCHAVCVEVADSCL